MKFQIFYPQCFLIWSLWSNVARSYQRVLVRYHRNRIVIQLLHVLTDEVRTLSNSDNINLGNKTITVYCVTVGVCTTGDSFGISQNIIYILRFHSCTIISLACCKTTVTPLLTHWCCHNLALSPRFDMCHTAQRRALRICYDGTFAMQLMNERCCSGLFI